MAGRLAGKYAVITGAASGQGRAGALRFAREGADLALCDRDADGLAETVELVRAAAAVEVSATSCDLADFADVGKFARAVVERRGVVDVVYNNAGVMLRKSIEETTEDDWDRVHGVNVKAPFFLVKEVLPALVRSAGGAVLNVSSTSALLPPREGNTVYCSSKGALMALTRAQARDLAPHGIRVNCIVPGPIDTAMPAGAYEHLPEAEREAARSRIVSRALLKRFGTPDEVASVAVFLATPESSFVTGAMIPVDGGWTAS